MLMSTCPSLPFISSFAYDCRRPHELDRQHCISSTACESRRDKDLASDGLPSMNHGYDSDDGGSARSDIVTR